MIRLVETVGLYLLMGTSPGVVDASSEAQVKVSAPAPKVVEAPVLVAQAPTSAPKAPEAKPAPKLAQNELELVKRMQAFYEKTQDFSAKFTQVYSYKTFRRKQTSSGTVIFKKPGLMRWEYLKPTPRTFVLAGDKVYMHDPDAKMLTRAAIDTSQLSASVTFLFGKGNLADEFEIAKKDCKTCKGTLLELTPKKPDPRFQKVLLEVDPKTAQVLVSTVIDPDGSENRIVFDELKANVGISADAFKLTPPAGTQVVDYTAQGQAAPKP